MLLFDGTDEAIWNKYIGGKVPVTAHFTMQSTIDKDPAKMQAYVTALWRATQWLKAHSPDEIYDTIEPYVGSTSRKANVLEIAAIKKVADFEGTIDAASFARGEKVWFREMTGIKPLTMAEVVSPDLCRSRAQGLSGLMREAMSEVAAGSEQRIDVRGLSKTFQLAGTAIEAVRDVSLQRPAWRVRCAARALRLRQEHGAQHDRDPDQAERRRDPDRRRAGGARHRPTPSVGYVFQRDTLFPWRTVADNIGYGLQLAGRLIGGAEGARRGRRRRAQA